MIKAFVSILDRLFRIQLNRFRVGSNPALTFFVLSRIMLSRSYKPMFLLKKIFVSDLDTNLHKLEPNSQVSIFVLLKFI